MVVDVKLFIFAGFREALDCGSEIIVKLPKSDWQGDGELKSFCLKHLKDIWVKKQADRDQLNTNIDRYMNPNIYLLAINESYVDEAKPLIIKALDRVALIQPVNGG